MPNREQFFFILGMLIAISLGATVAALSLQLYLGRGATAAAFGQGLAMVGTLFLAMWLRARNGRQ